MLSKILDADLELRTEIRLLIETYPNKPSAREDPSPAKNVWQYPKRPAHKSLSCGLGRDPLLILAMITSTLPAQTSEEPLKLCKGP